jgi:dihydroneopterin triphosphate diphosphatase
MRAPFQVLVIPFRKCNHDLQYACLTRSDEEYAQFVAGGGEGMESPLEGALRELHEETGLRPLDPLWQLKSIAWIPVDQVRGRLWGPDVLHIPEHAFAAHVPLQPDITLSAEHVSFSWLSHNEALAALKWESNRAALRELHAALMK